MEKESSQVFEHNFVSNPEEIYYALSNTNNSILLRRSLTDHGSICLFVWDNHSNNWVSMLNLGYDDCDRYGICGPCAICYNGVDPECRCLQRFRPRSQKEWDVMIQFGGCKRNWQPDCGDGQGLLKFEGIKLLDEGNLRVSLCVRRILLVWLIQT